MEKQVLSIEWMQELVNLGIDTSKASMFWHPAFHRVNGILDYDRYEDIPHVKLENNYNLKYDILTFTLQDILEMLPLNINFGFWGILDMSRDATKEYLIRYYNPDKHLGIGNFKSSNILEAAFNMLKWCKQNNYV